MLSFINFGIWISSESMQNRNLQIHTLKTLREVTCCFSHFCAMTNGSANGKREVESETYVAAFRGANFYVAHCGVTLPNSNWGIVAILEALSSTITHSHDRFQAYVVLLGHNNVPDTEIKSRSVLWLEWHFKVGKVNLIHKGGWAEFIKF